MPGIRVADPKACQCGEVLKGVIKPWECKVFGTACTPETPIGTCMVSPEGACAAYYNFGRLHRETAELVGQSSAAADGGQNDQPGRRAVRALRLRAQRPRLLRARRSRRRCSSWRRPVGPMRTSSASPAVLRCLAVRGRARRAGRHRRPARRAGRARPTGRAGRCSTRSTQRRSGGSCSTGSARPAGHYWATSRPNCSDEAAPTHGFHVFGVYPWTRLLDQVPEPRLARPRQLPDPLG